MTKTTTTTTEDFIDNCMKEVEVLRKYNPDAANRLEVRLGELRAKISVIRQAQTKDAEVSALSEKVARKIMAGEYKVAKLPKSSKRHVASNPPRKLRW